MGASHTKQPIAVLASPSTTPPPRKRVHVPQLDGLRGIAVAAILLFHLGVHPFRTGFLGVDVFFVISGFLITSLLLSEADRTGRISLGRFWARRIRRLLPALVVFLLVVAAVGALVGTVSERRSLRGDLLATTTYVANWHLIGTSNYFVDVGIDSPLEHTWSLAIEEQFYLIWPLVIAGALVWLRVRRRTLVIVATAGAIISVALLFARWQTGSVERAYMGTDARVFEPLIGALGAIVVTSVWARRTLPRHARWITPVSAGLVALGLATISAEGPGYFTWGALALSLATVTLIAVVWTTPDAGAVGRGLSWTPLVWIGTISYGIYLWHWPVYLWLGVREPNATVTRRVGAILATIAIAAVSYMVIERPIRQGSRRASGSRMNEWLSRPRNVLIAMPCALAFVACASLRATTVPPVSDAALVIMMTGDSVPKQIIPALEAATESRDWRFVDATAGGCPVTGEEPVDPTGFGWTTVYDCRDTVVSTQQQLLTDTDPQIVLWWDRPSISNFRAADDSVVMAGSDRFWQMRAQGLKDGVERLSANGAIVILMATEPPGVNLASSEWAQFQIDHYGDITSRWDDMLRAFAKAHPANTLFVDVRPIVCPTIAAPCDDMVGGIRARHDGQHYEKPGSSIPMPTIVAALQRAGEMAGEEASAT
jgi:peptidoglycan/LPS O-acetylase OafA/YrhL